MLCINETQGENLVQLFNIHFVSRTYICVPCSDTTMMMNEWISLLILFLSICEEEAKNVKDFLFFVRTYMYSLNGKLFHYYYIHPQ